VNRRLLGAVAVIGAACLLAAGVAAANPALLVGDYEETTVTAVDGETNATLATVEVRVADTLPKQYVGLSATDDLAADEGMLFVHDESGEHAYVMRGMTFALDIVFVAPNGTVTRVHEADPESGSLTRYRGRGQYVLEVPRGWSDRNGVEPGDRLVFELA
jgi:uncharacterized membrane protein (UPF0127 family)